MLCECGCGKDSGVYVRTYSPTKKKGEPKRFLKHHHASGIYKRSKNIPPPNPSGICQCGCGRPAPIATMTNERIGHVADEPVRFIRGHVGFLKRHEEITPDLWREEDRGYSSLCWITNVKPMKNGYTRLMVRGEQVLAHREMYRQEVGSIEEGLHIDHLCRQRACINPSHLEQVTQAENVRRSPLAKLTLEQVKFIRQSTLPGYDLAEMFGVTRGHIYNVRSGVGWAE